MVSRVAYLAVALAVPVSAQGHLPAETQHLCPSAARAIDASADETLAQGSPGMIVEVASGGTVLFTGAYGLANLEDEAPVTGATVFSLASLTKQFTAASILLLAEEGKVKLGEKLSVYVPELPQADRVTLYQLLVQTSGIPDFAEDPVGQKTKAVARTPDEMVAWIATLTPTLLFEPGTRWSYSNSNYVLLGLVIERASGRPLLRFYQEGLFVPAGLAATSFDDPAEVVRFRAQGYRRSKTAVSGFRNADWISPTIPGAAGGLRGTADDLVRWNAALFGGKILKPESLDSMIAPGLLNDGRTTKAGMPEEWRKGLDSDYAMGLFVKQTPVGMRIAHSGDIDGFSTWAAYYPARKVTIVHMINSESADMATDAIEAAVFSGPGNSLCVP